MISLMEARIHEDRIQGRGGSLSHLYLDLRFSGYGSLAIHHFFRLGRPSPFYACVVVRVSYRSLYRFIGVDKRDLWERS